jgi:hypothetical protein
LREEAIFDCTGKPHDNEESAHEANVEAVRAILQSVEDFSKEYHTEGDFPDALFHMVGEVARRKDIKEWVEKNIDADGYDCIDNLVEYIWKELDFDFDCDPVYDYREYFDYSGDGCCLAIFDIGECEEQIVVREVYELNYLHDKGLLNDILKELDNEFCISLDRKRVKDENTGLWGYTGEKHYNHYNSEHPCFSIFTLPGGQWHFVVENERMHELCQEYRLNKLPVRVNFDNIDYITIEEQNYDGEVTLLNEDGELELFEVCEGCGEHGIPVDFDRSLEFVRFV